MEPFGRESAPEAERLPERAQREEKEMKLEKKRIIAITLMLTILILVSTSMVLAVPGIPHQFYGSVTVDGLPAPDWLGIAVDINGVFCEWTYTEGGEYGYSPLFNVLADDPDTPAIEGGVAGDVVEFYVDGFYATSYIFKNGEVTCLNLDIVTTVYELQLYAGWNLIGIPGIPVDPSIDVMLYNIMPYVESVWAYDGMTGYWSSYSPYAPSDLDYMFDGKGYWIKMTSDIIWEMDMI